MPAIVSGASGGVLLEPSGTGDMVIKAILNLVCASRVLQQQRACEPAGDAAAVTPTLVVVPPSALKAWQRAIAACAYPLSVYCHHGKERRRWASAYDMGEIGHCGDAGPLSAWAAHGRRAWRGVQGAAGAVCRNDIVLVTYNTLCCGEWTCAGGGTSAGDGATDARGPWLSTAAAGVSAGSLGAQRAPGSGDMESSGVTAGAGAGLGAAAAAGTQQDKAYMRQHTAVRAGKVSLLHSIWWRRIVLVEAGLLTGASSRKAVAVGRLRGSSKWCVTGRQLPAKVGLARSITRFLDGDGECDAAADKRWADATLGACTRRLKPLACSV